MSTHTHGWLGGPRDADALRGRAWIAVALIPVFFFLAFAVGEGLYSLLGYPTGTSGPLWVEVVVAIPTLALFEAPCVAGVVSAERARRLGDRRALLPLAVAAAIGCWFFVLAVVTTVSSA